jgi:hypothetical protein
VCVPRRVSRVVRLPPRGEETLRHFKTLLGKDGGERTECTPAADRARSRMAL